MTDGQKILIVDDDKFLLDMYSMKFTSEGFTVQASLSAHDALTSLTQGYQPAVILFDLTMPECDGFEFLQELKKAKLAEHALKFALTNQSNDEDKKKAQELGADQFLVKATMIPSEVVNTVKAALSGQGGA